MHGHPQWGVTVILLSDRAHFHFSPLLRHLSFTFLAFFIHIREQRINASINWCNDYSVVTLVWLEEELWCYSSSATYRHHLLCWLAYTLRKSMYNCSLAIISRSQKCGKSLQRWRDRRELQLRTLSASYMTQIKLLSVCPSRLRPPHVIGCTVCVCVCAFATLCQCLAPTVISNVCIFSLCQCV